MTEVQGTVDPRFEAMREILQKNIDSGADLGASVAVVLHGEPVVDLWGGWSDTDKTVPWGRDTIVNVWSSTKTMMALSALVLADRGELDVYEKVAHYWPEFAANGKADIEVRHLLSHTSGVSGWAQPVVVDDLYDWEKSTSMLAAQAKAGRSLDCQLDGRLIAILGNTGFVDGCSFDFRNRVYIVSGRY
jgi:CubicO group peptidase (beta-lactamase class C family)